MALSAPDASRIAIVAHNVTSYPGGAIPDAKMAGKKATAKHVRFFSKPPHSYRRCFVYIIDPTTNFVETVE